MITFNTTVNKVCIPKKIAAAVLIAGVLLLCGCNNIKNEPVDEKKLSDLGGVFSNSLHSIDFSLEISGVLTEGENYAIEDDLPGQAIEVSSASNKILRWGTLRKPNHQTPGFDPGSMELLKKYNSLCIGDTSKKTIYLTFDEGYENGYTAKILDVLRDNNVKAIFFITGPYLRDCQDLVRRMVEEGHEVGNHTINHPSLPELDNSRIEEEVLGLDRAFSEKFRKNMRFLRPPRGEYSERTLEITSRLGYTNLFWSFAYDDWYRDKIRGAQYAYDIVMRNLHNGAVLLLHAVSKDNADALDSIIKGAREQGYTFGDPEELLKLAVSPDRKAE